MTGTEHIPRSGGALLAVNHISYVDFVLGGFAAQPSKRLVRFMAKRELFDHQFAGPLMRSLHHINVDRADGLASYEEGLRYLRMGEVVGIFPEATISRSFEIKELKTGATRMAAEAGVPLVPVILWGTQRMLTKDHPKDFSRGKTIAITVGEPLHPDRHHPVADTAELREHERGATPRSAPTLRTSNRRLMSSGGAAPARGHHPMPRRNPADEQPPGSSTAVAGSTTRGRRADPARRAR